MTQQQTIDGLAKRLAKLPKEKRTLKSALNELRYDEKDENSVGQAVAIASFALEGAVKIGHFDSGVFGDDNRFTNPFPTLDSITPDFGEDSSFYTNPFPEKINSPSEVVGGYGDEMARIISGKTTKEPTMSPLTESQKYRKQLLDAEAARLRAYAKLLREEAERIQKEGGYTELWRHKFVDAERHEAMAIATEQSFRGQADGAQTFEAEKDPRACFDYDADRFERAVALIRAMPLKSRTIENVISFFGTPVMGTFHSGVVGKEGNLSVYEAEALRAITEASFRDADALLGRKLREGEIRRDAGFSG